MPIEEIKQEGLIPRPGAPAIQERREGLIPRPRRHSGGEQTPKRHFFDPDPSALLPREPVKPLTSMPKVDDETLNYTRLKVNEIMDHNEKADLTRDIYTQSRRDAEAGGGIGIGEVIDLPDRSDPTYAALSANNRSIVGPEHDTGDPVATMRSVANFLFSDEMGLLGMKWDEKGFDFGWNHFKNQLVEHPISTAITVGSYMVPIGAAWMKGSRLAHRANVLMKEASDPALRQIAQARAAGDPAALRLLSGQGDQGAAAGSGILGSNLGFRFDEHSRLVKSLAGSAHVADGRELINPKVAEKILAASTPDEVRKLMSEKDLRKILMNDWHTARSLETGALAKSGALDAMPGIAGVARRAHYAFQQSFGNSWMDQLQNMSGDQIDNIDKFWKNERFSDLYASLPSGLGKDNSDLIVKYRYGKATRDELEKAIGTGNVNAVDGLIKRETELFERGFDNGYYALDGPEATLFGKGKGGLDLGYHLPAVKPGTPGFGDFDFAAKGVASSRSGRLVKDATMDPVTVLTGPTTKHRGILTTPEKTIDALGELETDVRKLAVGGYIMDATLQHIHLGFRDMITNSLRGIPNTQHWIKSRADYDAMGAAAKKNFISFDELDKVSPGLYSRMDRMLRKDLGNTGQLNLLQGGMPAIDRALVQQMFGRAPGSAAYAASMAGIVGEMLTSVHKTMATTLNPPTQILNPLGNMIFVAMRGTNPFSKEFLNDAGHYTDAFTQLAKQHMKAPDLRLGDIMDPANMARVLGKNRYVTGPNGTRIDMAELIADPRMRDGLLEAQGFESVEGLTHFKRLLKHLNEMNSDGITPKVMQAIGTAIGGAAELPGVKQTLNAASAAYIGSDMVPKMALMASLARKGYGKDAILMEVGRTLPQYGTVGGAIQSARRMPLPWVTFTAETARIMKNNIADHPVAMMAWMQAPQFARGIASAAGVGADFSQYDSLMENAPPWATKFAVMLNEGDAPTTVGAFAGAATGGIVGTAVGGFKGGIAGAAAGGTAGAALGSTSDRSAEIQAERQRAIAAGYDQVDMAESARAWVMDFLPFSSLVPGSLHPHEWEKINPFSDVPSPGMESLKAAVELSPVEPFAIAKPLLDLAAGRDNMGNEIIAKSGVSMANKLALGLLGFLAPPMIAKYGMSLATPGGFMPMSYVHDANGGQMSLPSRVTPTYDGLLDKTLSFMFGPEHGKQTTALGGALLGAGAAYTGAKRLPGVSPALAAGAAGVAGVATGMAGAEINTRRLMVDLGLIDDHRTGERHDPTVDFWLNNWLGGGKSWKVGDKQGLFNKRLRDKRFEPYRAALTKEWEDYIQRGSVSEAMARSEDIYQSFALQTGSTTEGHMLFADWLDTRMKKMNRLPMFRDMSDEWIDRQIRLMKDMGPEKAKVNQQQLVTLMTELKMHRFNKAKGRNGNGLKVSSEE